MRERLTVSPTSTTEEAVSPAPHGPRSSVDFEARGLSVRLHRRRFMTTAVDVTRFVVVPPPPGTRVRTTR
jgi:hypothetical protein